MTTVTSPQHDENTANEPAEHEPSAETRRDRFGNELPRYDDINTPVILLVGVISAIITFLTIAFVEGLSHHWQNGLIKKINYDVANPRQAQTIEQQKAVVTEGDQEVGILSLEDVMDDVIAKYRQRSGNQKEDSAAEKVSGEPLRVDQSNSNE